MNTQRRYPREVKERAVRMVLEHEGEYDSQWAAISSVAAKLGMTAETLRKWVRRAETDGGLRSSVVTPERRPPSVSARRTHLRSVSAVMPNFAATELIAAHWESYSPSCSSTMRTARSFTSRGYLLCVFMTPSSQRLESPAKAGRFSCRQAVAERAIPSAQRCASCRKYCT